MSKEAVFILSIATVRGLFSGPMIHLNYSQEEFVKRLAQAGQRQASARRRGTVNYTDLCK